MPEARLTTPTSTLRDTIRSSRLGVLSAISTRLPLLLLVCTTAVLVTPSTPTTVPFGSHFGNPPRLRRALEVVPTFDL
jgi:hypothetical protein